jgi:hypothetical protein
MTQELNKEGLRYALAAFHDRPRYYNDNEQIAKAIQAYLTGPPSPPDHTKVTEQSEFLNQVSVEL